MGAQKTINLLPEQARKAKLLSLHPGCGILDTFEEQLRELFLIRNPRFRFNKTGLEASWQKFYKRVLKGQTPSESGRWFYFPWLHSIVHFLPDEMHQELHTARNKHLIRQAEQKKFYNFTVGIAGLSVGSHAALTLAMMGGGRRLKLADFDTISASNLNRIRAGSTEIGESKCHFVARHIWEMNPYAELKLYDQGITEKNLHQFLAGKPKLDVLVECLDNPELKIRLRLEARKLRIPVVMATDNGDNVIFDIERYDRNPNLRLFNGVAGNLTLEQFQKYPPTELPKLATKIAGPDVVVPKMLHSVTEVGKSLYSWPQLGNAATLAGVTTAYVIKRLALNQKIKTGKLDVNLDSIFDPDYHSAGSKTRDKKMRNKYLKILGF